MSRLQLLIALLPLVFMAHEFEEIVFLRTWQRRGMRGLKRRFPLLSRFILMRFHGVSTGAFALAVAEEFVISAVVTVTALWENYYQYWLALFVAFSLHLVAHVVQWMVVRRYIPVIVTSLLALPYSVWMTVKLIDIGAFSARDWLLWGGGGTAVMAINLLFVHRLAGGFSRWERRMTR